MQIGQGLIEAEVWDKDRKGSDLIGRAMLPLLPEEFSNTDVQGLLGTKIVSCQRGPCSLSKEADAVSTRNMP